MVEPTNNDNPPVSIENRANNQFFIVSTNKLAVLYILTFGLYTVYWFYQNWKLQQPFIKQTINPPLRSIFSIFFTHSLFRRISTRLKLSNITTTFNPGLMATAFVGLVLISSVAESFIEHSAYPTYLIIIHIAAFILSILPLQEAQDAINQLSRDPLGQANDKYSWMNITFIVIGCLFWLIVIFAFIAEALNLIPPA